MSSIQIMFDEFVIKKNMQMEEEKNPTNKRCGKCSVLQTKSEFHQDKSNPDGLRARCISCRRQDQIDGKIKIPKIKPPPTENEKVCNYCERVLPKSQFVHCSRSKDGLSYKCLECDKTMHSTYNDTIQGELVNLFNGARTRAEKKFPNKISKVGEIMFTLTIDELEQKYIDQEGKCFWFPENLMSPITNSPWKMSIDRLDQRFGYHAFNIVLCCLEFNVCKQWSWKKIQEMMQIKQIDQSAFNNEKFFESLKERPSIKQLCNLPEHKAHITQYANGAICTICRSQYQKELRSIPYGFLITLASNMKRRDDKCQFKSRDLAALFAEQKGDCVISGLPLVLSNNSLWQASPEREDPTKNYSFQNTSLICLEFNSSCNRGDLRNVANQDDTQWTKIKFVEWYECLVRLQDSGVLSQKVTEEEIRMSEINQKGLILSSNDSQSDEPAKKRRRIICKPTKVVEETNVDDDLELDRLHQVKKSI